MDPKKSLTVTYLGNSGTLQDLLSVERITELSVAVFPPRFAEEDLPEEWPAWPVRRLDHVMSDGQTGTLLTFPAGSIISIT